MAKKGASDWGTIYLLVVVAIAAVLIVTFVKPLFKSAGESAEENLDTARNVAGAALFLLTRNK